MLIKDLQDCEQFIAADNSHLRELLHPDKDDVQFRYSLAHAVVPPGETTLPHSLKTSELYYILEGEGLMHIDDEVAHVRPGQAINIPPRSRQFIQNTGSTDLKFLCIVDPAWRREDEEIL